MTWNPLKKTYLTASPTPANPAVKLEHDRELDTVFRHLQTVEDTNRRLQKEMKRYLEAISNAEKSEVKLTSELSSSPLCHENSDLRKLVEDYHSVAVQKSDGVSELIRVSQRTFQEPLKKFGGEFYGLAGALQAHEQLVQEWKNIGARLRKLEERGDRMPNTIVKIERERHNMAAAGEAIVSSHKKLLEELPLFLSKRVDYIQPCLQAMVRAQLDYHGNATRCFTFLLPTTGASTKIDKNSKGDGEECSKRQPSPYVIPEAQFQAEVQSKLSGIRALSIVKQSG